MLSPWINLPPNHKMLWRKIVIIWRVSNLIVIQYRILLIYVMQYWYTLSALRVMVPSNISTLVVSLAYLKIPMTLYFYFGRFISTRRLWSLSRKCVCMIWMSHIPRSSSLIIPLFKSLHMHNTICLLKSEGACFHKGEVLRTYLSPKLINWKIEQ